MDQHQHSTPARAAGATRRSSTIGLTAGLLAGGAIGLFALAPTFSNAATADPPQLQDSAPDESDTTTDGSDDVASGARPGATERLRDALQPLVDDGTIDAEQADAVASHLAELRPDHGDHRHRPGLRPGFDGEVVADLIGIDVESLREELRSGSTIAEIAEANGVDPQTVIDALVEEGTAHLDLAVESGRLTDAEAAEMAAQLEERVTARVNGERPSRFATS